MKREKTTTTINNPEEAVSMRELLECGVHFGHQTKRWNPKMKKYIFTSRNGIHVIDLQQTLKLVHEAYSFIIDIVKNNGTVLFVGTKKQAHDAIYEQAVRCKMPYINNRWLGGTLTNIATIRNSINKLKKFETDKEDGLHEKLSNKELARKTKYYNKLVSNLDGIKNMVGKPAAIFIVDTKKEHLAIKEAQKTNIPIVGVVDTNTNPYEVDYPIPANDDAIRAIKLLCSVIANAVIKGEELRQLEPTEEEPKKEEAKKEAPKKEEPKKEEAKKEAPKKEEAKKEDAIKEEAKKEEAKKEEAKKEEGKKEVLKKEPSTKKKSVKSDKKNDDSNSKDKT